MSERYEWPVVVPSQNHVCGPVHTHRDCNALREAHDTRPATIHELRQMDVCKACVGGYREGVTQDNSYQQALRRAANDD